MGAHDTELTYRMLTNRVGGRDWVGVGGGHVGR